MDDQDKFDYSALSAGDGEHLKSLSANIRALLLSTASMIDLGMHLISAKEIVRKIAGRSFGDYCNEALQLEKRSAQNYMAVARLARSFDRKLVEQCTLATAEQLARKSCPDAVRQTIFDEVRAGKIPTKEEVKTRIERARGGSAHKVTNVEADRLRQKLCEGLDPTSLAELSAFLMKSSPAGLKDFAIALQPSGGRHGREPAAAPVEAA